MFQLCAFADESSTEFQGQIDALKRNGMSLLEIRGVDGENIKDVTPDKARELRKMLDAEGLRGVIAELEGIEPSAVNVTLEGKDTAPKGAESDLENIF